MKILSLMAGMLIFFVSTISPTSINGRFVVLSSDSSKLAVLLQINTNTGTDDLGGATIVIGFNKQVLSFNSNPLKQIDYNFHNFSAGNYSEATVTRPLSDKIWINIDLPAINNNMGTLVKGLDGWTDLVTLNFSVLELNDTLKLSYQTNSSFWGVYDADNKTLWDDGILTNLEVIPSVDTTPPELVNASLIDSENLELVFSENLDSSNVFNKSNYSIDNGISVINVRQAYDRSKVLLQTSNHKPSELYTINVQNIKDLANNIISSSKSSIQYRCNCDSIAPILTGLSINNNQTLTVKFSEKLNDSTSNILDNYKISNDIQITQAELMPDSTSVILKTTPQQSGIEYTLAVSGIKDLSGNLIQQSTIVYSMPIKITGSEVKNTIVKANALYWEAEYFPDKSIDGLCKVDPDSRWESSRIMPDTINYDFGETVMLDSLRISFYEGDLGTLYKYSVYSSKDLKDWNVIVDNIWSDRSEWTEIEFDSTQARYISLILKESDSGKYASIWEFESYGTQRITNVETGNITPTKFELSQNYPNPFNPSTKIKYTIPTSPLNPSPYQGEGLGERFVTLKVYDILGNEVATLVNESQQPGQHEIFFDAAGLASGVYIYRIQTDAYTNTKKMILLR